MRKWLNQFLEKELVNRSDKSDRFDLGVNLSDLSGRPQGFLDENLEKVENNPSKGGDKSDRFRFDANMSPLSLRTQGLLDENLEKVENNLRKGGDKSDRFKFESNMSPNEGGLLSVLSGFSNGLSGSGSFPFSKDLGLLDEYEERLAITEYDGLQGPAQAERIAYLDAFIAVWATLPYEDVEGDWLIQRIKEAQ